MNKKSLLWVDDEVELLQPHVLFLEKKGYRLDTCHNGIDAISLVKENDYDLVFTLTKNYGLFKQNKILVHK